MRLIRLRLALQVILICIVWPNCNVGRSGTRPSRFMLGLEKTLIEGVCFVNHRVVFCLLEHLALIRNLNQLSTWDHA